MPLANQYALGLDVNALFPTVGLPQQADGAVTADIHGMLAILNLYYIYVLILPSSSRRLKWR